MRVGLLRRSGAVFLNELVNAGRLWRLAAAATIEAFVGPFHGKRFRFRESVRQLLRAGNDTLPLVALIAALMGTILALQSAYQLRQLGATHLVADLVAVSITRELGPLMTAILVAGRVGSAVAAELGTMKVSEEIDALTVIGVDPLSFLVVPRLAGLLIAVPCLTLFADLVGILAGCGVGVVGLGFGAAGFLNDSIQALVAEDLWGGVLKAFAFGGIIGLVGCEQGLGTVGGADEVGRSTTTAVVRSIVLIIAADLFVTALLYLRH
ncbi:MAG: ABC transporter permease [bacterium]|nr:ABC transporter permease [bacterium]